MRLIYKELDTILEWDHHLVPIIVIENLQYKNKFIEDLYSQSNTNEDDPFFISDEKKQNIKMNFEVIINPFDLEVNKRNIINKVTRIFENLIKEDYVELIALSDKVNNYLYEKSHYLPINVELIGDLNVKRLMQLFELSIADDSSNLLEKIMNYLEVSCQLGLNNVFIFVNLKQYLDQKDMYELYNFSKYKEIKLILIENNIDKLLESEKKFIIDKDLCLIF